MQVEKSLRGRRYGSRTQLTRFMLAARLASLDVLGFGASVRAEREEAVVNRVRSMTARRTRIILVGLRCKGHGIPAVLKTVLVSVRSTETREDFSVGPGLVSSASFACAPGFASANASREGCRSRSVMLSTYNYGVIGRTARRIINSTNV